MGRIKDGVYFWSSSPGGGTVGGSDVCRLWLHLVGIGLLPRGETADSVLLGVPVKAHYTLPYDDPLIAEGISLSSKIRVSLW